MPTKKHTLTLDIDLDDENPLLDDIAILFFQTDTPNYLFADDLNHLYRLSLARVDDLELAGAAWPFYTHCDTLGRLNYYLTERPLSSTKILIIRGEGLDNTVKAILRDFNEPPAENHDPLGADTDLQHRNNTLLSYQQALASATLYNPQPPTSASRKTAKERQELNNLLTSLLDLIDLKHL